jgi:hypothetical protein
MTSFTLFHVALSLVGIVAGFVVGFEMVAGKVSRGWTNVFLWTTLATSLTGFLFPYRGFTPAIGVGVVSTIVLGVVFYALYIRQLMGKWRATYVIGAIFALYLNFFVLIVQAFLKIPALHALAPTQAEPPFAVAQAVALLFFAALGIVATVKFRPALAQRA